MSYRRNTDTAIAYVNRHVPVMTKEEWDGLDEGMCEIVLSSIRQHFKDFYQKPKEKVWWRDDYDRPSMRDYLLRDLMYVRTGRMGDFLPPPVRPDPWDKGWEKIELPGKSLREMVSVDSARITPRLTRDRGVTVDIEVDYRGLEDRVMKVMESKALIQMAQAFGMGMQKVAEQIKTLYYDESHHVKPEELYGVLERTKVAEARPLVGAGKNPFAQHTIRSMKGKRK